MNDKKARVAALAEIERLRVEVKELIIQRDGLEKFSATLDREAEILRKDFVRACGQRDAAISRAAAAERERDEAREAERWTAELAVRGVARAEAAEVKVVKLREALKPFAELYIGVSMNDNAKAIYTVIGLPEDKTSCTAGDIRRARAILAETEE